MNDIELSNALKHLPHTSASPRFTSDVLRAARTTPARPRAILWRYAAAMVMTLCFVVIGVQAIAIRHAHHERIEQLRAEHQRIESELRQVKAVADDPAPVVVLENADTRVIVPVANHAENRQQQPIYY
jgi:type II secretory pathway component PulM